MIEQFHCLECDFEWEDNSGYYPKCCPNCNSNEFEEQYYITCNDCNFQFIGAEGDECPECGSFETQE